MEAREKLGKGWSVASRREGYCPPKVSNRYGEQTAVKGARRGRQDGRGPTSLPLWCPTRKAYYVSTLAGSTPLAQTCSSHTHPGDTLKSPTTKKRPVVPTEQNKTQNKASMAFPDRTPGVLGLAPTCTRVA